MSIIPEISADNSKIPVKTHLGAEDCKTAVVRGQEALVGRPVAQLREGMHNPAEEAGHIEVGLDATWTPQEALRNLCEP